MVTDSESVEVGSPIDRQAASAALDRFCERDPGRSAACEIFRGPDFRFDIASDAVRPGASLLKLPLVVAVERAAERGSLNLSTEVSVSELPRTRFPNVMAAFDDGRMLTIRELCRLTLITSDNSCSAYLWDLVGPGGVNQALKAMGCGASTAEVSFEDELLGSPGRRNTTTAADALQMFRYIYDQGSDNSLVTRSLRNNLRNQRIPLLVADGVPVAHKTGSLEGVVNDVGVIYGDVADVALAFLTDEQDESETTAVQIGRCVRDVLGALGLAAATQ